MFSEKSCQTSTISFTMMHTLFNVSTVLLNIQTAGTLFALSQARISRDALKLIEVYNMMALLCRTPDITDVREYFEFHKILLQQVLHNCSQVCNQ